jgi:hypothetical protein
MKEQEYFDKIVSILLSLYKWTDLPENIKIIMR